MNQNGGNEKNTRYSFFTILLVILLVVIFAINGITIMIAYRARLPGVALLVLTTSILTLLCIFEILLRLRRSMLHLQQQKNATSQLNEQLSYEMQELGIQNEKMTMLVELSDIVQACVTVKEATKAIAVKCRKILHFADGTLYILNPSTNIIETAVTWGDPVDHLNVITPDQCWALRKGGLYQVKNTQSDIVCEHIIDKEVLPYLCLPLMAQNSIFGLLHLDFSENASLTEENRLLILAVTETLSLALSNINLREKLRNQSLHDSLTGLFNRRYLDEFLEKEINMATRNKVHFAVVMLDIDFFKVFNDTYGHEAGDLVLQELGQFFQSEVRISDICCRYGGEEFICILHDCDLATAKARVEEMRCKIANLSLHIRQKKLDNITISSGIAIYPEDGLTVTTLIEAADKALYHAKNLSRNKVVAFCELGEKLE